jgi:hypothetical protein
VEAKMEIGKRTASIIFLVATSKIHVAFIKVMYYDNEVFLSINL